LPAAAELVYSPQLQQQQRVEGIQKVECSVGEGGAKIPNLNLSFIFRAACRKSQFCIRQQREKQHGQQLVSVQISGESTTPQPQKQQQPQSQRKSAKWW